MGLDWEVKKREKSGMTPFHIVWSLRGVERMDDMHILEEANQVCSYQDGIKSGDKNVPPGQCRLIFDYSGFSASTPFHWRFKQNNFFLVGVGGSRPACCKMFSNVPGLHPFDTRSPTSRRRQWQPTPVSTLAWKIPWTEEPGRLQSMGSLRVGQENFLDWATSLSLFTFMRWRRKWQPLQCSCLENPRDGGAC